MEPGDAVQLGDAVELGNAVELGDAVELGNAVELGDAVDPDVKEFGVFSVTVLETPRSLTRTFTVATAKPPVFHSRIGASLPVYVGTHILQL